MRNPSGSESEPASKANRYKASSGIEATCNGGHRTDLPGFRWHQPWRGRRARVWRSTPAGIHASEPLDGHSSQLEVQAFASHGRPSAFQLSAQEFTEFALPMEVGPWILHARVGRQR